jgi:hypothetical protein
MNRPQKDVCDEEQAANIRGICSHQIVNHCTDHWKPQEGSTDNHSNKPFQPRSSRVCWIAPKGVMIKARVHSTPFRGKNRTCCPKQIRSICVVLTQQYNKAFPGFANKTQILPFRIRCPPPLNGKQTYEELPAIILHPNPITLCVNQSSLGNHQLHDTPQLV